MVRELTFETKVHKTTDRKRLATKETKIYDYGALNIRSPDLVPFIGKTVKVVIKLEK